MKMPLKYWFGILAVLLLVTWLGARKLNVDGVWFDEWWSLYVAGADNFNVSRSIDAIWQRIAEEDIRQGIFYPYALAGWGSMVGWTEYATRALSLLAGLIAVSAVFRLTWASSEEKSPFAGLAAAILMGSSVWFIFFLHEMRVYMLMVMFVVLVLLFYQRIMVWRREPRLWNFIVLAIFTGLLLNTHYFAGIVVGVLGLAHIARLFVAKADRRWWGIVFAWGASTIFLLPWLLNLPAAAQVSLNEPRVQPDIQLLLEITLTTFSTFGNTHLAVVIVLLVYGVFSPSGRRTAVFALIVLLLNLGAYAFFSLNELRYNIALLPLLALVGGVGAARLAKHGLSPILILGLWALSPLLLDSSFQVERMIQRWPGQPIREMAGVLAPHIATDDVIVNLLGDENRPTLALHPLVHYMGDFGARIEVVENSTYPGIQNFVARTEAAVADANHVWLLFDPRWQFSDWGLFEYLLNQQGYYHCATLADDATMVIWGFGKVSQTGETQWQFGDGITLGLMDAPKVGGDYLYLWLEYQVRAQIRPETYSTAVHLLDSTGTVRQQIDIPLPSSGTSCRYLELAVGDLPSGDYALHTAVYAWHTGERLLGDTDDQAQTDYPVLGYIRLE